MKNKQSQSGSGHLVIIILIVLVVLGGLGFAYYANFMKPKADDKPKVVVSKTISINPSTTAPIYFTYPGNWTVERETTENVGSDISIIKGSDIIKIYSPSKDTYVEIGFTLHSWYSGYGEAMSDSALTYESEKIENIPSYLYVQSSYQLSQRPTQYYYVACLSNFHTDTFSSNFSSGEINPDLVSIIPFKRVISDDINDMDGIKRAEFTAHINKSSFIKTQQEFGYYPYVSSVEEINNFFATSEFTTAKNILLSARLTE